MIIRTTRIVFPLFLLGLALLLSSQLVMRLFFVCLILELIGFLWAFLGARKLHVAFSKLPVYSRVGDRLTETITVNNDAVMPGLLLSFEEVSDMPGFSNTREMNLKPKSSLIWQVTVNCTRRGRYHLGSGSVTAGDPLGIFCRKRNVGERQSVLVYPAPSSNPTSFFARSTNRPETCLCSAPNCW